MDSPSTIGEPEELVRQVPRAHHLRLDRLEERSWLHSGDPLRSLQASIEVEEGELVLRGGEAVVRVPGIAHQGPLEPVEHLADDILAAARGDPIDSFVKELRSGHV
jgi:hypothetical protein